VRRRGRLAGRLGGAEGEGVVRSLAARLQAVEQAMFGAAADGVVGEETGPSSKELGPGDRWQLLGAKGEGQKFSPMQAAEAWREGRAALERQRELERLIAQSYRLCPAKELDLSACRLQRLPHSLCRAWGTLRSSCAWQASPCCSCEHRARG